ncbi:MAG: DUF4395 domain-containing protein [Anaerolineales bacterium]|nr:DUF4395 domain-containing protein [Chloroflexota bacterium]MBL6979547.1 DUF4395 domain-containing protein [Anaerolineales bacterium]
MHINKLTKVDHTALKTNQALIITLNVLAFILNVPWLALIVTVVMILGILRKKPGFGFIYRLLKPSGWPKPDVIMDNPEPHRFAQGFGAVVMLIGSVSLYTGALTLGWALIWLVVALAALNLFAGFCIGCALYYWLNRFNLPGFSKSPPEGTFPGMRPSA